MLPKLRLSALSRVSLELRHEHWHDHVGRYQLTPKTQLVDPGSKRLAASSHKKRRERAEAGTKKRAVRQRMMQRCQGKSSTRRCCGRRHARPSSSRSSSKVMTAAPLALAH